MDLQKRFERYAQAQLRRRRNESDSKEARRPGYLSPFRTRTAPRASRLRRTSPICCRTFAKIRVSSRPASPAPPASPGVLAERGRMDDGPLQGAIDGTVNRIRGQHRAARNQSAAQSLGQDDHIRLDPEMMRCQELPVRYMPV